MKPEITGNGFGKKFVHLVLDHVNHQFQNPEIWLSVAQFNQRAIKVYENAGFVKVDEIQQATNGGVYDFVRMKNQ
jgi:ribosomal-protein-alanine N-acetyltransferase